MFLIAVALALVIGTILGLLGGGGAILTTPMLVYAAGVEPRAAVAMSLFPVGVTSLAGLGVHARSRAVRWRVGGAFGIAAMAGAFLGGRLAGLVSARALLVGFAAVMITSSAAMFGKRERRDEATSGTRAISAASALGIGAAVGLVSGMVGAGGGFLVVPVLATAGRVPMREAIGTSLLVIAMQSLAGFAGHVMDVSIAWGLLLAMAAAMVSGGLVGAVLGRSISVAALRLAFAALVLAVGLFIFAKEVSWTAAVIAGGLALSLAFLVFYRSRVIAR